MCIEFLRWILRRGCSDRRNVMNLMGWECWQSDDDGMMRQRGSNSCRQRGSDAAAFVPGVFGLAVPCPYNDPSHSKKDYRDKMHAIYTWKLPS
jgi:hypothetical protein